MRRFARTAVCLSTVGLALTLPRVAAPVEVDPPPPSTAIYGGHGSAPTEWESVVAFVRRSQICSGTLITPSIVLTAAHCVRGYSPGEPMSVVVGENVMRGRAIPVIEAGADPSFCADCDESVHDFAYLRLAEEVPLRGALPGLLTDQPTWDEVMYPGKALMLVGFGESDDAAATDPFHGTGVKRAVPSSIRDMSGSGLEFLAAGGGKGTCAGDSGGPAFAQIEDGSLRLVGVLSRGICGETSFYGSSYSTLCWLRDAGALDVVPRGCTRCDCLDTQSCAYGAGSAPRAPGTALAALALATLLARRRAGARRRGRDRPHRRA